MPLIISHVERPVSECPAPLDGWTAKNVVTVSSKEIS